VPEETMAYVTLTQLKDRFGEQMLIALTDRGADALGVVDEDVVDRAIAEAEALIDGYLARRYALPLSVAQPMLVGVAGALVIYGLHIYEAPEKVAKDYNDAIKTLTAISQGTITLNAAGVEAPSTGTTGVQITDRERPFTEDNMTGFI
jgi:phage gp36-like protein